MSQAPKTSGKAIGSLVCSCIGIFVCGIILGIVGIVLGRSAIAEIDASGGTIGGRGLAQAGIIVGVIALVLSVIVIILYGLAAVAASAS